MESYAVAVDEFGRIVLPDALRVLLEIRPGETVLNLIVNGNDVAIVNRQQALARIHQILGERMGGVSLADELIADRRREAAAEDLK